LLKVLFGTAITNNGKQKKKKQKGDNVQMDDQKNAFAPWRDHNFGAVERTEFKRFERNTYRLG